MTHHRLKKLARALRDAIAADPDLAKPSYQWCLNQLIPQEDFARRDWQGFVAASKSVARKAG